MTYSEKLKDPRWQRKRLEILSFWNFTCAHCGSSEKTLHVHHQWYVPGREPWQYPTICFQPLCEECRRDSHEDTAHYAEWELLLSTLFDPRECAFDAMGISFSVSERLDEGMTLPAIRNAIEQFILSPPFEALYHEILAKRRARFPTSVQEGAS